MRRTAIVILAILLPLLSCVSKKVTRSDLGATPRPAADLASPSDSKIEPVNLPVAATTQTTAEPTVRKIIRNAELTIEINSPADGQRRIAAIAETHGGFVVTSEFKQVGESGPSAAATIRIIVRVPAAQFTAAVEEIRGIG